MEEILKELDSVFQLISGIPVTYDSVDTMAVARSKLRRVYAELKNKYAEEHDEKTKGAEA